VFKSVLSIPAGNRLLAQLYFTSVANHAASRSLAFVYVKTQLSIMPQVRLVLAFRYDYLYTVTMNLKAVNVDAHPMSPANGKLAQRVLIGVLNGEGVGTEVISAALQVARATADRFGFDIQGETGGAIGLESKRKHTTELSSEVIDFCSDISRRGGAILSGPGGGSYVYKLRRHFQLYYKINPLHSFPELAGACRLKIASTSPADIVLVRENLEGIYQGVTASVPAADSRTLAQTFYCSERNVRALMERAALLAMKRSRHITVVVKRGGLPEISTLWEECARDAATQYSVRCEMMDIDFAAYQLLQAPNMFDVIASPNCFGDILADIGALLSGSRGLSYGGSYSAEGFGVYQTNHGCAYDLAGKNQANPVGQIFSLAMLLRESLSLPEAADGIVKAVRSVWAQGWRTSDLVETGTRLAGTEEMGRRIAEAIRSES
jgi:3-isopropylmalate dehydrogenase